MDKSMQFKQYREEYKDFYFNSYLIEETKEEIYLKYEFEIPGLTKFNPVLKILKKKLNLKSINTNYAKIWLFI